MSPGGSDECAPAPSAWRVRDRLAELAGVGGEDGGGVTRLAYTEREREAHRLFARWAQSAEASCDVDGAGNSIAVFRAGAPYFLIGSHLDTVVRGGRYDGAAGVVGALEVAQAAGETRHGIRVVAFAGEE